MPHARPLQANDPPRLGDYDIVGRLGEGGQGVVYLGQSPTGGSVAVKLLRAQLSEHPVARSRFIEELEVAKQVATFCTAAVLDADVAGHQPYIVSEYVEGPSLQQLVAAEGPRGQNALERLAVGTATALTAIHRAGVVHRDFKPGNVLLGNDGPRVIDFGIARALDSSAPMPATGQMVGTPAYMAPEQLSGVSVGPASDVWAWGATMLFAATAALPFGNDSVQAVMQRIMYDDPDLSPLPASLRDVVKAALDKDPTRRPTARQILDRLLGQESPVAAMPEPMVSEARTLVASPIPPPLDMASPLDALPSGSQAFADPGPFAATGDPAFTDQGPFGRTGGPAFGGPEPFGDPGFAANPGFGDPLGRRAPWQEESTAAFDAVPPLAAPVEPADRRRDDFSSGPADFQATSVQQRPSGWDPGSTDSFIPGLETYSSARRERPQPPTRGAKTTLKWPQFRGGNAALGVIASLAIGVLAGSAIIALVLWPTLKGGSDGDGGTKPSSGTGSVPDRPVDSIPDTFAGTWRGTATNTQRGATFPLEVTFKTGGTTADVRFPTKSCTGVLTFTNGTQRRMEMSLEVTKGCTSGSVVVTKQANGSLDYAWSRPGTSLSYRATLKNN